MAGAGMQVDSVFLNGLIGHEVRILSVDEAELPPMILEEVSSLGVVAASGQAVHFLPWREVVEIRRAGDTAPWAEPDFVQAALAVDSEL
jgi:hypothetical protein